MSEVGPWVAVPTCCVTNVAQASLVDRLLFSLDRQRGACLALVTTQHARVITQLGLEQDRMLVSSFLVHGSHVVGVGV
jgi:hypothetical protein